MSGRYQDGKRGLNEFDIEFKQFYEEVIKVEDPDNPEEEKEKTIIKPGDSVAEVVDKAIAAAKQKPELVRLVPDITERGIIYFRDVGYLQPPFERSEDTQADFDKDYLKQALVDARRFGPREMINPSGIFYDGNRCVLRMMVHLGEQLKEGKHFALDLREFRLPLADVVKYEKKDHDFHARQYGPAAKIRLIPLSLKWYKFENYRPANPLEGLNFKIEEGDDECLREILESFGWEAK